MKGEGNGRGGCGLRGRRLVGSGTGVVGGTEERGAGRGEGAARRGEWRIGSRKGGRGSEES
jgi:hypothetical protein